MRRINYISQNDFEKDDLYQEVLIKIYLALERHHFQYDDSFINIYRGSSNQLNVITIDGITLNRSDIRMQLMMLWLNIKRTCLIGIELKEKY